MSRISLLTIFAMAFAVVIGGRAAQAEPRIGDPAPALSLPDLEGKPVERAERSVAVVDFYATWCGPCQDALVHLGALAQELGPSVSVILVDVSEPATTVRAFFTAHPLPPGVRLALDTDGAASVRWGRHRFPTTFVVDAAGAIRFINRGYGSGYGARIMRYVRQAMVAAAR